MPYPGSPIRSPHPKRALPLDGRKEAVDEIKAAALHDARCAGHDVLHVGQAPLVRDPPPAAEEELDFLVPPAVGDGLGAEVAAERVEEGLFEA